MTLGNLVGRYQLSEGSVAYNFTAKKEDNHKIKGTDTGEGGKKMDLKRVTGRWWPLKG